MFQHESITKFLLYLCRLTHWLCEVKEGWWNIQHSLIIQTNSDFWCLPEGKKENQNSLIRKPHLTWLNCNCFTTFIPFCRQHLLHFSVNTASATSLIFWLITRRNQSTERQRSSFLILFQLYYGASPFSYS